MLKRTVSYLLLPIWVICIFITTDVKATHIVGGELNYKYLDINTYEITLTVYRDCGPQTAAYDTAAWVGFFDQNNDSVAVLKIPFNGSDTLPVYINSDCANAPPICYEVARYVDTIILPPIAGGYQVAYQRCCWNLSVNNIKNYSPTTPMGSSGLTIYTKIPDMNMVPVNSNPIFQELTPPFICLGTVFEFNHAAVDPDGDSLAYRIVTPYNAPLANSYEFPLEPPYKEVEYVSPYNLANVMGGEALRVDPKTGFVRAKPEKNGQFVFAVEVLEFRNGVQIGTNRRSYQLNVSNCPGLTTAYIESPDAMCGSTSLQFGNGSKGATKYYWNFGDPNNPGASSSNEAPFYIYPGNGKYKVTLIAYSDIDSVLCSDTTSKEIIFNDKYDVSAEYERDPCFNRAEFMGHATSLNPIHNKYYWKFGDGGDAYVQNPIHSFKKKGTYYITMIAQLEQSHEGCIDSVIFEYNGYDKLPWVNATADKSTVYKRLDSVFLSANTTQAVEYSWKPAKSLSDPKARNPIAKPQENTIYVVTILDSNGCKNRDTVSVAVNPYRCGESDIFIPNAFTPNNDGENDYFRVRGEDIKELYLAVYNRWGQLIYESTETWMIQNERFGWDGTFNGEQLPPGVFVYYMKATCPGDNEFIKKGNITLLR